MHLKNESYHILRQCWKSIALKVYRLNEHVVKLTRDSKFCLGWWLVDSLTQWFLSIWRFNPQLSESHCIQTNAAQAFIETNKKILRHFAVAFNTILQIVNFTLVYTYSFINLNFFMWNILLLKVFVLYFIKIFWLN